MWKSSFFYIPTVHDDRRHLQEIPFFIYFALHRGHPGNSHIFDKMNRYAIIVAGGSGSRFGSSVPKQFLPLAGTPVLMHTIRRFFNAGATIILVLPHSQVDYWNSLCRQHSFTIPVVIVKGGDSRFRSVKNGIDAIDASPGDIIAIHDGVRPLVSRIIIETAFNEAAQYGSAIPVVPVTDSIRQRMPDGNSASVDRSCLVAVQTPQAFDAISLKAAYSTEFNRSFTDDASVMEHSGHQMHLMAGDPYNIKITHPGDIEIAEILLRRGEPR